MSSYSEIESNSGIYSSQNDKYLHKYIKPISVSKDAVFGDPSQQQSQQRGSILYSQNYSQPIVEKVALKGQRADRQQDRDQQIYFGHQKSIRDDENMLQKGKEGNQHYGALQNPLSEIYEMAGHNEKQLKAEMSAELREVLVAVQDRMQLINSHLEQLVRHKAEELNILQQFKEQTSRKLQENLRLLIKDKMSEINRQNVRELKDLKNLSINTVDRMFSIQSSIASFTLQVQKIKDSINQQLAKYEHNLSQIGISFEKINQDNRKIQASLLTLENMLQPIRLLPPKLDLLDQKLNSLEAIQNSIVNLKEPTTMFQNTDRPQYYLQQMAERNAGSAEMMKKMMMIEEKLQGLQKLDTVISMLRELKASSLQKT